MDILSCSVYRTVVISTVQVSCESRIPHISAIETGTVVCKSETFQSITTDATSTVLIVNFHIASVRSSVQEQE